MAKLRYYGERLIYEIVRASRFNKHKIIFIHIPKSAGMTIRRSMRLSGLIQTVSEEMLCSKSYVQGLRDKMSSIGDHHGIEHARYKDLSADVQKSRKSFAVIRNPWDRVASRYYFAKQVIEVEKKYRPEKHMIDSFEAFLEERHVWGDVEYMWHRAIRGWYPCFDYVTDKNNNIVHDILRFEHLNHDLTRYFGLKKMSRARNVTSTRDKKIGELYNSKTIQIVADWYQSDIDNFGYDFGSSPTKNTFFS